MTKRQLPIARICRLAYTAIRRREGTDPWSVGTTSAGPSGLTRSRTASSFGGQHEGHFAAAVSLGFSLSRFAGAYCACRTAIGRTSNISEAASLGPVTVLPTANRLLISEKPSATTDAFQASPDGHRRPFSVARANNRPLTTITAFRPLNRPNAINSFRFGPTTSSGR